MYMSYSKLNMLYIKLLGLREIRRTSTTIANLSLSNWYIKE